MLANWRVISRNETNKKYVEAGKHAKNQENYVARKKEENPDEFNKRQANNQATYLAKKMKENPEQVKANQRKWKLTQRCSNDENARNRNFLEDSKYGPIFICICCHRKLAKNNVTVFKEDQVKIPLEDCIHDMNVYTNVIEFRNGKEISPNNR